VRLVCPVCGAEFGLEEASRSRDLLELARAAAEFGETWPPVEAYLERFRSPAGRLTVKRRLAALEELRDMWRRGRCRFRGKEIAVGRTVLQEALVQVGAREDLRGLSNHNYLKKVLAGLAEKEAARREATRETFRRLGRREPVPDWERELARLNQALLRERDPARREALQAEMRALLERKEHGNL